MEKLKPLDFLIFILLLALSIFLIRRYSFYSGEKVRVIADGEEYEYSAHKNGIYKVAGPIGETVFEIKDGKVRVIDSPCPNKTCISRGFRKNIICLPNKVMIQVEGKNIEDGEELDALAE